MPIQRRSLDLQGLSRLQTYQAADPIDEQQKRLSLKNLGQQTRETEQIFNEKQRARERSSQIRAVIGMYGGDLEKAAPEIGVVDYATGMQVQKHLDDRKTAAEELKTKRLGNETNAFDLQKKQLELTAGIIAGIKDQPSKDWSVRKLHSLGLISDDEASEWLATPWDERAAAKVGYYATSVQTAIQRAEEARKAKEDQHKDALRPLEVRTKTAEATKAEQEATGEQPVTPYQLEQLALTANNAARTADLTRSGQQETKRHNLVTEREGAGLTLSPQGLDAAAAAFARTGQLPALGMGASKVRTQIINRAAEINPNLDIASNRSDYEANKRSLESLTKSRDAVTAFENTAKKNLDLFLETSKQVIDTKSPWLNTPVRQITRKMVGSENFVAFQAARRVAVNEIAKITSNPNLTGTLSDSARHEIESFIPENATLREIHRVASVLKQDMENRGVALDEQISAVRKRIQSPAAGESKVKTWNPKLGRWE